MRSKPLQPLPAKLVEKLQQIGAYLEIHASVIGLLEGVTSNLFSLPAEDIAYLDAQIAYAANLRYRAGRRKNLFAPIISSRDFDLKQLKKVFGLQFLFLFHRDGFVREAALDRINGPLTSEFIASAILWRLNDWVPEVRAAALRCIERTFLATDLTLLSSFVPKLLVRIQHWQRWGTTAQIALNSLLRKDVAEFLLTQMLVKTTDLDVVVFRQLLRSSYLDTHLVSLALTAQNPMVRFLAVRTIVTGKASVQVGQNKVLHDRLNRTTRIEPTFEHRQIGFVPPLEELLRTFAKDSFWLVKCAVLDCILDQKARFDFSYDLAASLANEPIKPVRARAELLLNRIEHGGWLSRDG